MAQSLCVLHGTNLTMLGFVVTAFGFYFSELLVLMSFAKWVCPDIRASEDLY